MLRLGFYSVHDHRKHSSFSGVPFYTHRALSQHISVDLLTLSPPPSRIGRLFRGNSFPRNTGKLDAILALVSSAQVVKLRDYFDAPVIHVTDATPKFNREHYKRDFLVDAVELEREAVRAASAIVYSSDYFCRIAETEFGQDIAGKIHCLLFGANLDYPPQSFTPKTLATPIQLLWIGGDWHRKGGDTALMCLESLKDIGIAAQLTLIGDVPPKYRDQDGVVHYRHLNKDREKDFRIYMQEFERAHFLVSPTRADVTPMVVAEANAYSVPVLISNFGGIHSLLSDGVNGHFVEADSDAYAKIIARFLNDPAAYETLAQRAFATFQERFDWDRWANGIVKIAEELRPMGL